MGCPRGARETDGPSSEGLLSATIRPRDTPAKSAPFLSPSGSGLLDHVGCHASRSMRRRICRKRVLVKWLSASCRMKYRACRMGLAVVPGPRISQVLLDQRAQTEALVQLAREQQPHIGGDGSAAELDAKLGIEREANRVMMSRHPWGGALRVSEEPPRAAFLAGVERLWPCPLASQNEDVG